MQALETELKASVELTDFGVNKTCEFRIIRYEKRRTISSFPASLPAQEKTREGGGNQEFYFGAGSTGEATCETFVR